MFWCSTIFAQTPFAVSGNYQVNNVVLPPGTPDNVKEIFSKQISADVIGVAAEALPAGKLTIELTLMETVQNAPEKRGIAIFANGILLTPNLDIFKEAGGRYKPLTKSFSYDFEGGRLDILLNGIGVPAVLNAVKVLDVQGRTIAYGQAGTMKTDRISLKDNRTKPFKFTSPAESPFFNVDHSPLGAYASFVYGMESSGGIQMAVGRTAGTGDILPQRGVIVGAKTAIATKVMPFVNQEHLTVPYGSFVSAKEVSHILSPATDKWKISPEVSWTHYMPYWPLKEINAATDSNIKTFVLPATWMVFNLDNSKGKSELKVLLSLQKANAKAMQWESYKGYIIDQYSAFAVGNSDASLIDSMQVKKLFGVDQATSAFLFTVPKGAKKTISVIVAHYKPENFSKLGNEKLSFYFTKYYKNISDVIAYADSKTAEAINNCNLLDKRLQLSGISDERKFQVAQSILSYRYNTALYQTETSHQPVWTVLEGEYGYINTFDLTVDHVFHELAMHPWTVRNQLDLFEKYFSYTDQLRYADSPRRYPGGVGFTHDMGNGLNFKSGMASYSAPMTQEELQNWILCAGLYWKKTNDHVWLESKRELLKSCLKSMMLRDDVDSTKRDGITSMLSCIGDKDHDITTYDAMDKSLQQVNNSMYISVKSIACYLALEAMFKDIDELQLAKQSNRIAILTKDNILSYWNPTEKCFPAVFKDTSNHSKIIPAAEGLIYPYIMGFQKQLSGQGIYSDLTAKLKEHMLTVLKPGICINATGGLLLSNTSHTTWQSKVFLAEFVSENILNLKGSALFKKADKAQMSYQLLGAPAVGWSDQMRTENGTAYGGRHYPRGVTSALWWLYNDYNKITD